MLRPVNKTDHMQQGITESMSLHSIISLKKPLNFVKGPPPPPPHRAGGLQEAHEMNL